MYSRPCPKALLWWSMAVDTYQAEEDQYLGRMLVIPQRAPGDHCISPVS